MSSSQDWQNIKYTETFDAEIRGLDLRRAAGCSVSDIEGTLKHLYVLDGADQGGRGSVQDTIMAATIAAYEHYISCWKTATAAGQKSVSPLRPTRPGV